MAGQQSFEDFQYEQKLERFLENPSAGFPRAQSSMRSPSAERAASLLRAAPLVGAGAAPVSDFERFQYEKALEDFTSGRISKMPKAPGASKKRSSSVERVQKLIQTSRVPSYDPYAQEISPYEISQQLQQQLGQPSYQEELLEVIAPYGGQSFGSQGGESYSAQSSGSQGGQSYSAQSLGSQGSQSYPAQSLGSQGSQSYPAQSLGSQGGQSYPAQSLGSQGGQSYPAQSYASSASTYPGQVSRSSAQAPLYEAHSQVRRSSFQPTYEGYSQTRRSSAQPTYEGYSQTRHSSAQPTYEGYSSQVRRPSAQPTYEAQSRYPQAHTSYEAGNVGRSSAQQTYQSANVGRPSAQYTSYEASRPSTSRQSYSAASYQNWANPQSQQGYY